MDAEEFRVGIAVRAFDARGSIGPPTAAELSAALTFVHRALNLAVAPAMQSLAPEMQPRASQWREPNLVNVEILSVSNGSVILAAVVTLVSDPFAQGVAGGILANVIAPALLSTADRVKSAFRRVASASPDRRIEVDVDVPGNSVKVDVRYTRDGRTRVTVKAR